MNEIIPDDFSVGVIAATPFDTMLGVKLLQKQRIKTVGAPISTTPQEQTYLQIQKNKLLNQVENVIGSLVIQEKVNGIFIYCNSLSALLNLDELQEKFNIPIITPLVFYQKIATRFERFALLAANGQSVSHIERILLNHNPNSVIVGLGNLLLVNAIEEGMDPKLIVSHFSLIEQLHIFKQQGCECLLLGCTHFTYFYDELIKAIELEKISMSIFDAGEKMVDEILSLRQSAAMT